MRNLVKKEDLVFYEDVCDFGNLRNCKRKWILRESKKKCGYYEGWGRGIAAEVYDPETNRIINICGGSSLQLYVDDNALNKTLRERLSDLIKRLDISDNLDLKFVNYARKLGE